MRGCSDNTHSRAPIAIARYLKQCLLLIRLTLNKKSPRLLMNELKASFNKTSNDLVFQTKTSHMHFRFQ